MLGTTVIPLPHPLSKELRNAVNSAVEAYLLADPGVQSSEVQKKMPGLVAALAVHRNTWLGDLARTAEGLYALYKDHQRRPMLDDNVHRRLLAVLFYFVRYDDVIPDYQLQDGYLDDAYALNQFVTLLASRYPDIARRYRLAR